MLSFVLSGMSMIIAQSASRYFFQCALHQCYVEEEGHQNRGASTSPTYESMHVAYHIPQNHILLD
jgi:hypothetical protein